MRRRARGCLGFEGGVVEDGKMEVWGGGESSDGEGEVVGGVAGPEVVAAFSSDADGSGEISTGGGFHCTAIFFSMSRTRRTISRVMSPKAM